VHERGQATVDWLALVLFVALALGVAAAPALRRVRASARSVVAHAASLPPPDPPDPLVAAYGARVAVVVRRQVPGLVYERGMREVPVDPRICRARRCAEHAAGATLFTHVVRTGAATYVQYWEYFPDSAWNGIAGRHADDWESYQVRVEDSSDPSRVAVRASAHHGYTGRRIGRDLNLNQVDPRLAPAMARGAWTSPTGWLRIARGSHAGYVARGPLGRRTTPAGEVALVALETATGLPARYAVAPPWRKRVYADPESPGT
jgi:hypothetical protein